MFYRLVPSSLLIALLYAVGAGGLDIFMDRAAYAQLHVPNFQLGLPLGVDNSLSDLHTDRTPELHINWLFREGKVEQGLSALDQLLKEEPARPILWLMRAYGHELQGKYGEALRDFDQAQTNCTQELAIDRHMNMSVLLFKGIALSKVGQNQQALKCFDEVITGGGDAAAYYGRGLVYQDMLQSEKAIENFNEALKADPNNPAWLEGRAFSYCTQGEFSKALADCNHAIAVAPSHLSYETRAWVYHGLHQYDKAIEDTDRALQLAPDSVIAFWRRGLAHLAQNKAVDALADFNKGLAVKSSSLLLRDRALAEVEMKQYEQAVKDATAAMDELAKEAQPYRIRALAEYGSGQYKKALEDWNTAVRLEPNDAFTYARRGNTNLALGEWQAALDDFIEAEKLNAQLSLHAEKSRAYRHLQKITEALAECNKAIENNPKDETAYEARARVYLAEWDNDSALKDADTAISIANDPKWISPHEVKALVYSQREQWHQEIKECDRSLTAGADEAAMYVHRAYADHRLGDYKKALADLDEAVKIEPSTDNYAARADAHLYTANYEAAIADAEQAIKLDADNSYGYMARGAAYGHLGDKDKMRNDFQKGLSLDKEPVYAHATIAEYNMDLGLNEDAVKEYTAAVGAEPGNAQLYRWRGQALLSVAKPEEALADFDKALSLESYYPVAYAYRAEAYIQLGDYDKAIADCNKAIELDQSCALAYVNRASTYDKIGKLDKAAADRELAAKIGK